MGVCKISRIRMGGGGGGGLWTFFEFMEVHAKRVRFFLNSPI